jgi:hypothetical protein
VLAGMLTEVKCRPCSSESYSAWRQQFAARLRRDFVEISRSWLGNTSPPFGETWLMGSLELAIPSFPELRY